MPRRIILVIISIAFASLVSTAQARQASSPVAIGTPQNSTAGMQVQEVPVDSLTQAERRQMQLHPIRDPQVVRISGERVGLGCRYRVGLYLAPNEHAKQFDELSSDAATCTMIGQRGVPTNLDSTGVFAGTTRNLSPDVLCGKNPAARAGAPDAPEDCGGGGGWPRASGYNHAWYEDPLTIHVTDVTSNIDWVYGNGLVQGILGCWLTESHFSSSDWRLTYGPTGACYLYSGGWQGHSLYLWGRTEFANLYFCNPTSWTYNTYNENWVQGSNGGGLWGWTYPNNWGDCSSLLSYHQNLVRTR